MKGRVTALVLILLIVSNLSLLSATEDERWKSPAGDNSLDDIVRLYERNEREAKRARDEILTILNALLPVVARAECPGMPDLSEGNVKIFTTLSIKSSVYPVGFVSICNFASKEITFGPGQIGEKYMISIDYFKSGNIAISTSEKAMCISFKSEITSDGLKLIPW